MEAARYDPRHTLFFTYVAMLHVLWAGLLVVSDTAAHATSTAFLLDVIPNRYLVSALLLAASGLVMYTLHRAPLYTPRTFLAFVPQAIFILLAATAATQAVLTGEFGDGVQRSHWFIAADQAPPVLAAVCHQWALAKTHAHVIRRYLWKE